MARLDERFSEMEERVQSAWIDLKDIQESVTDYGQELDVDPERKQWLSEQLDSYNRLLQKHKCSGQEELVELCKQLEQKASGTEQLEEEIAELEREVGKRASELEAHAQVLHAKRLEAVDDIQQRMSALLAELKLPDTRLLFSLSTVDKTGPTGNTTIELLFSANKGIQPIPIENAASGGELSRVMLALQKLISDVQRMPSIFFDEIDTGVSGDVAQKMGNLLHTMGGRTQLFAISHLPQVAARAQHHFKVEKFVEGDETRTRISPLLIEQRVEEIARLMSGEEINEAAISNAKALMQ